MLDQRTVHQRRWWALGVLCFSMMVIGLDNTILNVALPALVQDLNASTSQLQWIVDGYTLVFAGLLLTSGSLGDRFGRRGALSIGLAIFSVGSLASAFSTSAGQLIFTRGVMGIGAALIMPSTLSLLTNIFSDPKERGRAIGVWAAVAGGSGALGPVIGGFLLSHFWWGAVFFVNVPVCLFALVAGRFLLPESRDPSVPRLDPIGALLSILGLIVVLWAVIQAPVDGWGDAKVVVGFIAGALILFGFVEWELHTSHPMLNVRFFENRRFTAANASITILFFALYGSMFLITQYLQTVLGYSPLEAGVRMLPMAAFMLTISPMAPRIVEKVGTKLVVGTGILLVSVGMVVVSSVPVSNGYLRLLIGLAILSSGMGCVMAPATESIMGSLPPSKAGVGSAMNDTTRQMGGALGVAVIGSILASGYRPKVAAGLTKLGAPDSLIAAAKDSVGGAVDTARSTVVEPLQSAAISVARSEYVHAFAGAMRVAAVIVAIGAVIAFAFLPAHARDARESVEGPLDGIASLTFAEAEGVLEEDAAGLLGDGSELVVEGGGAAGTAGPSVRGATGPRDPERR